MNMKSKTMRRMRRTAPIPIYMDAVYPSSPTATLRHYCAAQTRLPAPDRVAVNAASWSRERLLLVLASRPDGPVVMASSKREGDRRKESFDEVADAYDAYRARPPAEVVDGLVAAAGIHEGSRVLEIACGTGQLSVPLAERGVDLVAVELGPHLAAHARRHLRVFSNARVVVSSFEDWELPNEQFDAVVCSNAFHWLDADARYSKPAAALRPGGFLTVVVVHHVRGGTPGFFAETQPYYLKWGLNTDPSFQLASPDDLPTMFPELGQLADFDTLERQCFEIPMHHTSESYVGWLSTDSLVNTLDDKARRGFLDDIERLIESSYNGAVVRNFVYEVITARRAS
jgi:SAM-dependent methyltransferase